jgi:hypothetical protein
MAALEQNSSSRLDSSYPEILSSSLTNKTIFMSVKKSWFKENLKDILWTFTALNCVFGPVFYPGLSDYANHSFWWKFWDILAVASGITLVAGWCYFWFGKKNA